MAVDSSKTPEFSIITVCRNEVEGIRRTCESIICQRHQNFEWIVIDGASTDGTLEVLEQHRQHITVLVSQKDDGIYDAMNKGIALSKGTHIVFMNGGDAFSSDEVLDWVSKAPEADLIYGQLELNEPGGELLEQPEIIYRTYLMRSMIHHQASFFHRSLFDEFGVYDTRYRIAGDYDFFIRILAEGGASHQYVAKPFAVFDRSGISSSRAHRMLRKRENHWIRMQYFPEYRPTAKAWRQRLRNLIGGHRLPKS